MNDHPMQKARPVGSPSCSARHHRAGHQRRRVFRRAGRDALHAGRTGAEPFPGSQDRRAPIGFADIVEKVKPAVISVRVKSEATPQLSSDRELPFPKGSPMEQFFRRFGMPDGVPTVPRGRQFGSAQGSGFFISADGYAVTNNHVVDKATTVEVASDDGKTHTAKVIGTDSRTDLALIKVDGRQASRT